MNRRSSIIGLMARMAMAAAVGLVVTASVQAATWDLDPAHSSATFKVKHLMISNVTGGFGKVTGVVNYDPADLSKTTVEATIETTSLDSGVEGRDKHLKSPDFLDVEKFPSITFKSKKVEKAGDGRLKVTGDLTIRGVTKEVVLDVEGPMPEIKDPWGNVKSGASATTKINRQDFGVSWSKTLDGGGLVVSDEVTINIDVEMVKKK
ncbi:MAG TPA: YceI family protein [Candidatus Polarisedimenticolia bacterium]|nr:YceI family protein [Candidatus Polarisedimenticolia bacterium]